MIEVIFDTETTGLIAPGPNDINVQPYITEIYCYKQLRDGDDIHFIADINTFVKPPVPISAEITKITGITDDTVASAPTFHELYGRLSSFFVGVDRIVAHNLSFDRSMLANELLRIDKVLKFPWPPTHVCTVEKSLHYEQRRLSLTRLHEHLFATGFSSAHRAKNDVMALLRCYNEMMSLGDIL